MTNFAAFKGKEQTYKSVRGHFLCRLVCCNCNKQSFNPSLPSTDKYMVFFAENRERMTVLFLYIFNFSLVNMAKNNENCSNVKYSSVTATSAHETCTQFITFVKERYPMLNSIKFRLSENGKCLAIRARYKRRAIHAAGCDFEKTMSCFMFHLIRKMSLEKYYPTRAEMIAERELEPFFVAFNCSIRQQI